jgi:23S rRNA (uridine2552-2'-O)-methyltransferase
MPSRRIATEVSDMKKPATRKPATRKPATRKPATRKPSMKVRPNPVVGSGSAPGTFRFGRDPFGVFNVGDTMVHGQASAYLDVFDAKRRPLYGGIAITAIPEGGKRGPVWVFAVPDGRDAPYLDGQAHTEWGRVWASARWASADRDAVIVSTPSTAKKSTR